MIDIFGTLTPDELAVCRVRLAEAILLISQRCPERLPAYITADPLAFVELVRTAERRVAELRRDGRLPSIVARLRALGVYGDH